MTDFNLEDLFSVGYGTKDVNVGKHVFSLRTLSTIETSAALQVASVASQFRVEIDKDAEGNPVFEGRINEVAWLYNSAKNILKYAISHIDGKTTENVDLMEAVLEKLPGDIITFLYNSYQQLESEVEKNVGLQLKKS